MNDVRYSELLFLQTLQSGSAELFFDDDGARSKAVGLKQMMYIEMVATLIEDLYVCFDNQNIQLIVARLRGELDHDHGSPSGIQPYEWHNPRDGILSLLRSHFSQRIRITYRGLRRIEELRELLRTDRILEPFGILLDIRYFLPDLRDGLSRPADVPVSVIYSDMDRFKPINDEHGHAAGDLVMKAYLEAVQTALGQHGTAFRGRGDEVVSLVIGQGHKRAVEIAEGILSGVASLRCEYQGRILPNVTASIGVASTPPEPRTADIETISEARNRKAKDKGRNCVVAQ